MLYFQCVLLYFIPRMISSGQNIRVLSFSLMDMQQHKQGVQDSAIFPEKFLQISQWISSCLWVLGYMAKR